MDTALFEEEGKGKKKAFGKKKDGKADKKDKGYVMFEEENSEGESLVSSEDKEPKSTKLKKHSKPSFKLIKKEKQYKPKEKEKEDKKKDEKKKPIKKCPEGQAATVHEKPIFGVPLTVAVARNKSYDGIQLPAIFRECIDYVEELGLHCEGIYRISGVKSKVQALKEAYNKGHPVYLQEYEPYVVAALMKQFLRELPEPVLTTELMPKFEQASIIKNVKQRVGEFQRLIGLLPTENRLLLSWVIVHMTHVIAKEKQNKMSLQNVSIVLSPTMQISHRVLNVLFTASLILFKNTIIYKYVPPLKPVTSHWFLELPESPSSLQEELRKQELLLDELHREVMRVKDKEKEEQLWEVQRVVTGLKRKLKLVTKTQSYSPSTARSVVKEWTPTSDATNSARSSTAEKPGFSLGGDEDLDLRRAESFSQLRGVNKQTGANLQTAAQQSHKSGGPASSWAGVGTGSRTLGAKKLGGLRPIFGTPAKDRGMDIGIVEVDESAQSHSQRERADSAQPEHEHLSRRESQIDKENSQQSLCDAGSTQNTEKQTSSQRKSPSTGAADSQEGTTEKVGQPEVDSKTKVDASSEAQLGTKPKVKEPLKGDKDAESSVTKVIIEKVDEEEEVCKTLENTCDSRDSIDELKDGPPRRAKAALLRAASDLAVPNPSPANYIDEDAVFEAETHADSAKPEVPEATLPEAKKSAFTQSAVISRKSEQTTNRSEAINEHATQLRSEPDVAAVGVTEGAAAAAAPVHMRRSMDGGVAPEQLAAALSNLVLCKEREGQEDTPGGSRDVITATVHAEMDRREEGEEGGVDRREEERREEEGGAEREEEERREVEGGAEKEEERREEEGGAEREVEGGVMEIGVTEEELNERIMSQFVADFGIERPEECDEEYEQLLEEYTALVLEERELTVIGDELRNKIEAEQYEFDRLEEDLADIRAMREDLYSSEESESEGSEDEEELQGILERLTQDNSRLQRENKDLTEKIHTEVQDCLKIKVQIRLLQNKQLESSRNNQLDLLL